MINHSSADVIVGNGALDEPLFVTVFFMSIIRCTMRFVFPLLRPKDSATPWMSARVAPGGNGKVYRATGDLVCALLDRGLYLFGGIHLDTCNSARGYGLLQSR